MGTSSCPSLFTSHAAPCMQPEQAVVDGPGCRTPVPHMENPDEASGFESANSWELWPFGK